MAPKQTGPSTRQLRVAQEIHHIVAGALTRRDFHSDVLDRAFVTITEVQIAPDLRHAKIHMCILDGSDEKEILTALNDLEKHFRTNVARKMTMKYTPRLRFVSDKTLDEAMRIHNLLRTPRVQQDLNAHDGNDADGADNSESTFVS